LSKSHNLKRQRARKNLSLEQKQKRNQAKRADYTAEEKFLQNQKRTYRRLIKAIVAAHEAKLLSHKENSLT
jgi:hypothetical protein